MKKEKEHQRFYQKKIANSKRKSTYDKIGIRVGRVLNKYKMGKFINISIKDDTFICSAHLLM